MIHYTIYCKNLIFLSSGGENSLYVKIIHNEMEGHRSYKVPEVQKLGEDISSSFWDIELVP